MIRNENTEYTHDNHELLLVTDKRENISELSLENCHHMWELRSEKLKKSIKFRINIF